MAVFRIYVEKKSEFATEARALTKDILGFLEIAALKNLRILTRYDVEGISKALFDKCTTGIFSEPQSDYTYDEPPAADFIIATEYLPGQFNQRADSCQQCIRLISKGQEPVIRIAKIYLLYGALSPDDLESIRNYIINPVESREVSLGAFDTLTQPAKVPEDVEILEGFRDMDEDETDDFLSRYNLAMDRSDLIFCRDYFCRENRDPSFTEIRMIDTYWSDHCRHTTFLTRIEASKISDKRVQKTYDDYLDIRRTLGRQDKPVTLMDMATVGARYLKHTGVLTTVDESEEVNACSVMVNAEVDGMTQPWLLMFKNETHNHPTEIEPFGGASTCLGGAIRDPLSGRAYLYQAMRITGAANPLTPAGSTLAGKLPQRRLTTQAAAGYSSYGNQIGIPAGLLKEIYHPGYAAKRMEMGAVVAAAPASHVVRETPIPGDAVILLGEKTGRDGCGGATGSSKSHDISSLEKGGAEVQKGNAPAERKILRLFRNGDLTRLIKRCNDFGAGGVSVAVGELADSLEIDLDAVPVKYSGLDGTELAISESQERMALVVANENINSFMKLASEENLEATVIARVTDSGRLIMNWRGKKIVDISREFLNSNGTPKYTKVEVPSPSDTTKSHPAPEDIRRAFKELVSDINHCSQKGLIDRFDSTAGAGTVLMPLGGLYQETPAQAMVSKLPVLAGDTSTCSALSWGFNPYLTEADPYLGSYYAVVESVAKLVACGGDLSNCWLSFQEYFEKLGDDPLRWGKPFSALLGALKAQLDLGLAAIGGKDSMSGSFEELNVPPTLVSVSVSLCKSDQVISPEFKRSGNTVLLLSPEYDGENFPVRESLTDCFKTVAQLIKDKKVLSAYALGSGGTAAGIFKMALGNRIGINLAENFDLSGLFCEKYGGFLLEWDKSAFPAYEGMPGVIVGATIGDFSIIQGEECIDLNELKELYDNKLETVFPTAASEGCRLNPLDPQIEIPCPCPEKNPIRKASSSALISGKPKVFLPVFPGTSGEYDAARLIEAAGAKADIMIFKNLTYEDMEESIGQMITRIRGSQIILLPSGMSCGDEPDGAAKFITTLFRKEQISESLIDFLDKRQGLMLGIGNGFQALVKLGLLPYGRITRPSENDPTIGINAIGRHQSAMVHTRIVSNNSPWFSGFEPGDIHTMPISCGEGRFIASDNLLKQLSESGQIAAQYVDLSDNPSMDIRFNPAGSSMAIEAIASPDGRILGKMGLSERLGYSLYKNVPGNKSQNLLKNAVGYYSF